jgi:hypothetical protein
MPFTPFHFGLGALVKSVTPARAFSFQIFALSQVLIDVQPGLGLFLGWDELHGWTHTYPGALIIALATMAVWRGWVAIRPSRFDNGPISNLVVASSALFGTLSHVWLDSQFHVEMARLTPGVLKLWQTGDVTTNIETACLAAAELALLIYVMRCLLCKIWQRLRGR